MKKNILSLGLFLLAALLPTGCSSDDDEFPKLNESDRISTVTNSGTVKYDSGECRWFILSSGIPYHRNHYYPVNLPKDFKQVDKKVKFTGAIYPYVYSGRQEVIGRIVGDGYFLMELIHIEENH